MTNSNLDPRFLQWKQIAHQVEMGENLSSFLSEKIISIKSDKDGMWMGYQPQSNSEASFQIRIDTNDLRSAGIATLSNGFYELGIERIISEFVQESETLIDIGANVGFYSCLAAAVNPSISIYAFEPNPNVRIRLATNLSKNNFSERVSVLPFGLGNASKDSEFYVPPMSGTGAGSLKELHPEEGESEKFIVSIKPLDQILNEIENIDLIKMDIEGAEFDAIQGARELIEKHKPVIIVELLRKWMLPFGTQPQNVVDFLSDRDYTCFAIEDLGLRKISLIDEDTIETNFLFFPSSKNISVIQNLMVVG